MRSCPVDQVKTGFLGRRSAVRFGRRSTGKPDGGDPIFGVVLNGDTKAYPQYNLVWHEIVNDVVGGESVAVTYCPLTGTAQGSTAARTNSASPAG